jgi:hypothetical protein
MDEFSEATVIDQTLEVYQRLLRPAWPRLDWKRTAPNKRPEPSIPPKRPQVIRKAA